MWQRSVTVENVTRTYQRGKREVPVLRGLSFSVQPGTMTFLVGPSGSGKSTLLYLIGALDRPTTGDIRLGDRAYSQLSEAERDRLRRDDIGFVFQSFNLLSNLTVLENVLVPFMPTRRVASLHNEATRLIERVGLADRIDHRPAELSGGEQQRVAIARALLKRPMLVLADEPTGELDTASGTVVFECLRELQAEQGSTVLVVTHDNRYIKPDDPVLSMMDGRLVETDPPG